MGSLGLWWEVVRNTVGEGLFPFLLHPSRLVKKIVFLATKATGGVSRDRPLVTREPRRLRGFAAEPLWGQAQRPPVSLLAPSIYTAPSRGCCSHMQPIPLHPSHGGKREPWSENHAFHRHFPLWVNNTMHLSSAVQLSV